MGILSSNKKTVTQSKSEVGNFYRADFFLTYVPWDTSIVPH